MTTPGGMPAAADCAVIDDAEAAAAQQVGRAVAVDADQVGHDVGRAILAAVDQQAHFRGSRGGRRILRDDDVGRIERRSRISATGADAAAPSCAMRISAARCDSPTSCGARAMRGPALSHTRTLRWRRAGEPAVGSCPSTWPAGTFGSGRRHLVDAQLQIELELPRPWRRSRDWPTRLGTVTSRARTATRVAMHGKDHEGGGQGAREQQDLAAAPHSGPERPSRNDSMVLHAPARRGPRRRTPRARRGTAASRCVRWRDGSRGACAQEEADHDCLVFLGLARAGAVDQRAARPTSRAARMQQRQLRGGKARADRPAARATGCPGRGAACQGPSTARRPGRVERGRAKRQGPPPAMCITLDDRRRHLATRQRAAAAAARDAAARRTRPPSRPAPAAAPPAPASCRPVSAQRSRTRAPGGSVQPAPRSAARLRPARRTSPSRKASGASGAPLDDVQAVRGAHRWARSSTPSVGQARAPAPRA